MQLLNCSNELLTQVCIPKPFFAKDVVSSLSNPMKPLFESHGKFAYASITDRSIIYLPNLSDTGGSAGKKYLISRV